MAEGAGSSPFLKRKGAGWEPRYALTKIFLEVVRGIYLVTPFVTVRRRSPGRVGAEGTDGDIGGGHVGHYCIGKKRNAPHSRDYPYPAARAGGPDSGRLPGLRRRPDAHRQQDGRGHGHERPVRHQLRLRLHRDVRVDLHAGLPFRRGDQAGDLRRRACLPGRDAHRRDALGLVVAGLGRCLLGHGNVYCHDGRRQVGERDLQ